MTDMNWVRLYMQINFTTPNEVTNAALPSLSKYINLALNLVDIH